MTIENLQQFARELLKYGEQMHLNWCAAMGILEVLDIPQRQILFARSVELFENQVHAQFEPLLERLEAVIAESDIQGALEKFLEKLPKDRLN